MNLYFIENTWTVDWGPGRTLSQLALIWKYVWAFDFNFIQSLLFDGKSFYSNRLDENEYIKNRKNSRLHRKLKSLSA